MKHDRDNDAIVEAFLEACPEWRAEVTYLSVPGHTPDEPFLTPEGLKALTTWAYSHGLIGHPGSLQDCMERFEEFLSEEGGDATA